jgi:hypothetical protein
VLLRKRKRERGEREREREREREECCITKERERYLETADKQRNTNRN